MCGSSNDVYNERRESLLSVYLILFTIAKHFGTIFHTSEIFPFSRIVHDPFTHL